MISTFAVLTTVEVLKIANRYWSTTVDLPELLQSYSATVYGDQLYMLGGGGGGRGGGGRYVQDCQKISWDVWSKLPDLLVGGEDSESKPITDAYIYNQTTNS